MIHKLIMRQRYIFACFSFSSLLNNYYLPCVISTLSPSRVSSRRTSGRSSSHRQRHGVLILAIRGGGSSSNESILSQDDLIPRGVNQTEDYEGELSQQNVSGDEEVSNIVAAICETKWTQEENQDYPQNSLSSTIETADKSDSSTINIATSAPMSVPEKRLEVQSLRLQGKVLHDDGDFEEAAQLFGEAGRILDEILLLQQPNNDTSEELASEAATCHIHEALCHLKNDNLEECIRTCTQVLNDDDDGYYYGGVSLSAAIRSRALHRRAKANVRLEQYSAALEDARNAAFLGDRGATSLYGKLLRKQQQQQRTSTASDVSQKIRTTNTFISSQHEEEEEESLNNPAAVSSTSTDSLLMSLFQTMNKKDDENNSISTLLSSTLAAATGGGSTSTTTTTTSFATSMLKNLGKRLDEEETRESIVTFVNNVGSNKATLKGVASMAGVPLSDSMVDQISNLCSRVNTRTLGRMVQWAKYTIKTGAIVRKTFQIISKNRHILLYAMLLIWIRSSILAANQRPLIVAK